MERLGSITTTCVQKEFRGKRYLQGGGLCKGNHAAACLSPQMQDELRGSRRGPQHHIPTALGRHLAAEAQGTDAASWFLKAQSKYPVGLWRKTWAPEEETGSVGMRVLGGEIQAEA